MKGHGCEGVEQKFVQVNHEEQRNWELKPIVLTKLNSTTRNENIIVSNKQDTIMKFYNYSTLGLLKFH